MEILLLYVSAEEKLEKSVVFPSKASSYFLQYLFLVLWQINAVIVRSHLEDGPSFQEKEVHWMGVIFQSCSKGVEGGWH